MTDEVEETEIEEIGSTLSYGDVWFRDLSALAERFGIEYIEAGEEGTFFGVPGKGLLTADELFKMKDKPALATVK